MTLIEELEDLRKDYIHLGSADEPFEMGYYHGGQEACREAIKIAEKHLKRLERKQKRLENSKKISETMKGQEND